MGLDGQRDAVKQHAKSHNCKIVSAYTEVESGKLGSRPALAKALAHAKSAKAMLIVAKLDRLSRNVAFLSALMESGVEFLACDNPQANRLTVHILAAVAEDETRRISDRTKAALKAAKARGMLLGSARPDHLKGREDRRLHCAMVGTKRAAAQRQKVAAESNSMVLQIIASMRGKLRTWQAVANELNAQGHVTARGKFWSAASVCQLAKKLPTTN